MIPQKTHNQIVPNGLVTQNPKKNPPKIQFITDENSTGPQVSSNIKEPFDFFFSKLFFFTNDFRR